MVQAANATTTFRFDRRAIMAFAHEKARYRAKYTKGGYPAAFKAALAWAWAEARLNATRALFAAVKDRAAIQREIENIQHKDRMTGADFDRVTTLRADLRLAA